MSEPFVSVMLPTYNQVDFVAEAISTALKQNYDNLEVVVADDGSTDGTVEVILEYAMKYPDRLVPLVNGPHLGITGNCQRNLKACNGKYIAFHAGDDVFLPGKIKKQVEWLEYDEHRVLCGHDLDVFNSDTGKTLYLQSDLFPLRSGRGASDIVRYGVPYGAVAIMVRATAIPPYGFDARLSVASDWKLWIDCLVNGGYYGYVEGVYARYRRHSHNVTSLYSEIGQDDQFVTLALVESRYPHLVEDCRNKRAAQLYGIGLHYLRCGEYIKARVHLMNAVRQCFYWKAYRALLLTLLPANLRTMLISKVRPDWTL